MHYSITNDTKSQYEDVVICRDCSFGTQANYDTIIVAHKLSFVFKDSGDHIVSDDSWLPTPNWKTSTPLSAIQAELVRQATLFLNQLRNGRSNLT